MKFGSSAIGWRPSSRRPRSASPRGPSRCSSISATRIPISRLVAGPTAEARIQSPSRVKRKKTKTIATHEQRDADHAEVLDVHHDARRRRSTFSGNGLSRNLTSGAQIQPASPLRMISSAIVAITTVSSPERESGWMIAL